jgi:hypothetical protein
MFEKFSFTIAGDKNTNNLSSIDILPMSSSDKVWNR